jgi:translocation and assembly module TamA
MIPARMRRVALAPALLLAAGCVVGRGTAEAPVVSALALRGVRQVDEEALREGLATQAPEGMVRRQATPFDPDALAVDLRRIRAFYRERGYYQAEVGAPRVEPDGRGRVRVTVAITEGAPVRVAAVEVEGLEEVPQARAVLAALPLKAGDVFTEAAFDEGRDRIASALRGTGYATATVTQRAEVEPAGRTATVRYQVTPGRRFRFGRVILAGTARVPRGKIADRVAREAAPGAWFDEGALARAQARVFDLGVFAGVRVTGGTPDPERGVVPVLVTVREAPFHSVRVGPGIGFQATRWDTSLQATWTNRNWLSDLLRLQLEGRAGYAWLPNPFDRTREGLVGLVAAEYGQPGAVRGVADLTARLEVERGVEPSYSYFAERARLSLPIRLAPRWTFVPGYALEVYQLETPAGSSVLPSQFESCPRGICLLSYFEQRLAVDLRDDPIETRRGFYAAVAVQEGFNIGGNGYRYLRFLPEARAFLPLGGSAVLAARARVGLLVPVGEDAPAPIVARFSSGGPNAMRGYYTGRLSPMRLEDGAWVPVGGNGLVDGSVELRLRLWGSVGGVLFVDAGNVSLASSRPSEWQVALDPTTLQWAAGLGLRYRTPFGPVRLDVGARLPSDWAAGVPFDLRFPPVPTPEGERVHREPLVTFHLTLGEAF